ncbi:2OG-Fe dioxygenase family protein [Micromonospora sp. NPDC049801]|uniref:2OG-Fe dioxygenase family protein n=1 Tax=unclassified Micromonospora TaxID=2617518 RepID=UPI0033CFDFDF
MSRLIDGYAIIDLPPVSQEVLNSYDNVPLDVYMGNKTRYKRFSQYKIDYISDAWSFELLPHRPYGQSREYNTVAGGIMREYEPLQADFLPYLHAVAANLPLDRSESWQVNVHQNRSRATEAKPGLVTPEGVHKDGHEYVAILVFNRHNVTGGEMRLWKGLDSSEPFWRGTVQPGHAALLDDRAVAHDVTDLHPDASGEEGHRDIVIAAFSRWSERWYGEEHDQAVLNSKPSAQ